MRRNREGCFMTSTWQRQNDRASGLCSRTCSRPARTPSGNQPRRQNGSTELCRERAQAGPEQAQNWAFTASEQVLGALATSGSQDRMHWHPSHNRRHKKPFLVQQSASQPQHETTDSQTQDTGRNDDKASKEGDSQCPLPRNRSGAMKPGWVSPEAVTLGHDHNATLEPSA